MNGIHDMGGMHGFGRVEREPDEPVFHARWEARVLGMSLLATLRLASNIDARRHGPACEPPRALGYVSCQRTVQLDRRPAGTAAAHATLMP